MSRVSFIEDIEEIREANSRNTEKISLKRITYKESSRDIESLLKRCRYVDEWLLQFRDKPLTELEASLLNAQRSLLQLSSERNQLEGLLREEKKKLQSQLSELKEKNKKISTLSGRIQRLATESGKLQIELSKRKKSSLRKQKPRKSRTA